MKKKCFFPFSPESQLVEASVGYLVNDHGFTKVDLNDHSESIVNSLKLYYADFPYQFKNQNNDELICRAGQSISLESLRYDLQSLLELHFSRIAIVRDLLERVELLLNSGHDVVITGLKPDDLLISGTELIDLIFIESTDEQEATPGNLQRFDKDPKLHLLGVGVEDENMLKFFLGDYLFDLEEEESNGENFGDAA